MSYRRIGRSWRRDRRFGWSPPKPAPDYLLYIWLVVCATVAFILLRNLL